MAVLRGIDDFVRTLANGVTFGLADRLAGATTSTQEAEAERTRQARENLGIVGDIAAGGATVLPIAKGFQVAGTLGRAVQAARGATVTPAAFPSATARIAARPVRYAAGATALTGLERGARLDPGAQAATPQQAPAAPANQQQRVRLPAVPRGGRDAAGNLTARSDEGLRYAYEVQAARDAAAGRSPSAENLPQLSNFQRMLQSFGSDAGGVTLNELAMLAQAENQSRPVTSRRNPTGRDRAAGALMQMAEEQYAAAAERIAAMPAGEERDRAIESASAARMAALRAILDPNPMDNALAERLPALE